MSIYDDTSLNSSYNENCFRQKLYRKSKHTFYVQQRFSEHYAVYENVKKCGRARQAKNDNIILRMHFVCWITKATGTESEYVLLSVFYGKDGYANAPQCYFSKNTACGHLLTALPPQGKKRHAIKKKKKKTST